MIINTRVIRILYQNINWFVLASLFFIFGIIASALAFGDGQFFLTELTESQQQLLEEMANLIFAGSPLRGISILFINNLLASLQMMLFGVILGIPPLLGLFTNGALLGSLVLSLGEGGISIIAFLLLGVLPHGIFELPAFLISAAFGLKMGFHLVFPLPEKKRGESFRYIWKEFFTIFPAIMLSLIIAAIIEVLATPMLLKLIIKK